MEVKQINKEDQNMEVTSRPTDLLKADHQEVLKKLDDLERVITGLHEPDAIMSDLKELGAFFKTEIWTHFTKEEDALFPEMKKFIPGGGPIGQMLIEHEQLREANERFQSGVQGYLKDPSNGRAVALIRENGGRIIALLRDHIYKEDNILFMMANMHLTNAQNRRILDLFERIEAGEA
jgi:hemerythrin-like domain-containing protein